MKKALAVIGVGRWGGIIARTIAAAEHLKLQAVVTSKSYSELQETLPFDGAIYREFHELISQKADIDGVIIATPPAGREAIVDCFLEAGIPVFAEKPLTLSARATTHLVEKSRRLAVPLIEDFTHLYNWPYLALCKNLSAEGEIQIDSIGGNRGPVRDYSSIYDYGPHDLSMVLQIFRKMPDVISVEVLNRVSKYELSVATTLDFGRDGRASILFGNAFEEKKRVFRCRAGDDDWVYDDTAAEKLTRNGQAYRPKNFDTNQSALEVALRCFTGRQFPYSTDESLWISNAVAQLTEQIADRVSDTKN